MLSPINQAWYSNFVKTYRRKPTILHIGNIANNGYNNAQILNNAGFDCDVISFDYYHMMGCPEWEDAFIVGNYGDDFFPCWYKTKIKGFCRPSWFSQGFLIDAAKYLIARRKKQPISSRLRHCLTIQTRESPPSFLYPIVSAIQILQPHLSQPLAAHLYRYLLYLYFSPNHSKYLFLLILIIPALTISTIVLTNITSTFSTLKRRQVRIFSTSSSTRLSPSLSFIPIHSKASRILKLIISSLRFTSPASNAYHHKYFLERAIIRIRLFKKLFPDRADHLSLGDIISYYSTSKILNDLVIHYDFVVAYATSSIPLLFLDKPFFTLEHGTLRTIPYENTSTGRLTALAYAVSSHTFVTNTDCQNSANFLTRGNFTLINHPYNEQRSYDEDKACALRTSLRQELSSSFLIFHPTRLDWIPETGYADKENIALLEAFLSLRQADIPVGLILCDWGKNASQAKDFLSRNNLISHVKFFKPMPVKQFELTCKASDLLADQFKLGAFGGVLFKSMCVGTPVISYINQDEILRQYQEPLPILNARTSLEIFRAVKHMYENPLDLHELGSRSQDWISRHHSARSTVNLQVDQFRTQNQP